jgi:hypothetical protein
MGRIRLRVMLKDACNRRSDDHLLVWITKQVADHSHPACLGQLDENR